MKRYEFHKHGGDTSIRAGSNAGLTRYPDTGHNAWDQAYSEPERYRWLLQHTTE